MSSSLSFENTDTILIEDRVFTPSSDLVKNANITVYMQSKGFDNYEDFYKWSLANRFEHWDDMARELHWFEPWQKTFEWTNKPFFKWFVGGKFNAAFRIQGRVDDVIKVSGHRLGSMEIESSLVSHPAVAEAAAIGKPDRIKGERVKVFVILKNGIEPSDELAKELKQHVRTVIGPLATPDELEFVPSLPKTRSGKIMRRVVRARELGEPVGDVTTMDA